MFGGSQFMSRGSNVIRDRIAHILIINPESPQAIYFLLLRAVN
jgi:hypothetical protein